MKIETIISTDLQNSVKKIIGNYAEMERQDRLMRLMKTLKNRTLLRGDRPDWWDDVTMSWLPAERSLLYDKNNAPTYKFSPNVFNACWQILQSAFATTGMPGSEFVPQNRKQPKDVAVANIAEPIQTYERTAINFRSLWLRNFRLQFTDGITLFHIRHVRSEALYGSRDVEKIVKTTKTIRPTGYECAFCGWFGSASDDATTQAIDKGVCPDCGMPVLEEDKKDAIRADVPKKEIENVAVGKELVDCYGLVESRLPFWCPSLERAPYAAIETLADRSGVLAAFHDLDDIETRLGLGANASMPDTSEAANDFARRLTLSPAGIPIVEIGKLTTYRRWWLRPEAFYGEKDKGLRNELLKEYPGGGLFQLAGTQFLDARAEKMDDHLVVCRSFEADGMYPDAIGDNAVPIQESTRIAYNMNMEAAEFASFPPVLVDKGVLARAIAQIKIRAAQLLFLELPAGKTLKDSYHQMVVKETSAVLQGILDQGWDWLEKLVGVEAAMRGGAMENTRTTGGYELAKNQALQRLASPYQSASIAWAEIEERLVHEAVTCRSPEELIEIVGQTMQNVPQELLGEALDISKGRIYARAEDSEAIPATWAQVNSAVQALLNSNNPVIQTWLKDPKFSSFIRRTIGIKGFTPFSELQSDRMDKLIPMMLTGKSVPFSPILNNAVVDLQLIQEWVASAEGMEAQANNPQGFAIIEQYATQAAQTMAGPGAAAPPQPQTDPAELQSREKIEQMKIEGQVAVAEITTKAQQQATRAKFETDIFTQVHQAISDLQQQQSDQQHQQNMAAMPPPAPANGAGPQVSATPGA